MAEQNILIYRWGSLSEPSVLDELRRLGYPVFEFSEEIRDYHADSVFAERLIQRIHKEKIQAVFSFDYFPLIAMICDVNQLPYVSWIYDCPLHTLNSRSILLESNYIFCFDRVYTDRLLSLGAKHCFHLPLAFNSELVKTLERNLLDPVKQYECDISFVGSFYNEDKNRFKKAVLTDYAKGFTDGLISAQQRVYGYNFLKECLDETIVHEVAEKCNLLLDEKYIWSKKELVANALGMEVTARERAAVVSEISQRFPVVLYTGSTIQENINTKNVVNRGYADYSKEVPFIFRNSRINLNITSKTIESGIPQRVLDILSCGGFCLTNFQSEIAEYFTDGEELVMYTGMEDLLEKVGYFLSHEAERQRIADAGKKRVMEDFCLSGKLTDIFDFLKKRNKTDVF